jgi:7-cyano-7-deazaguanine reductase
MSKSDLKALGSNGTNYTDQYDASQLEAFPRSTRREGKSAPMIGVDIWTAFEVSFLLTSGLPAFMVLRIGTLSSSKNIFESKSLKLYLNSFNNSTFTGVGEVLDIIERDLSEVAGDEVSVVRVTSFPSVTIYDKLDRLEDVVKMNFRTQAYTYDKNLLKVVPATSTGILEYHTDLLRSNCEITNQPDWGKVFIRYVPGEVEVTEESLLKYIVSLRTHQAFHEPTCELIYEDLYQILKPKELLVICQYTRRGGIDINPCRFTSLDILQGLQLMNLPKLIQQ